MTLEDIIRQAKHLEDSFDILVGTDYGPDTDDHYDALALAMDIHDIVYFLERLS